MTGFLTRRRGQIVKLALAVLVLLLAVWVARHAAVWLVRNHPEPSDAIVVLAGDANDSRYWKGLDELRAAEGEQLYVDVNARWVNLGQTDAQRAPAFIAASAGTLAARVHVCPTWADSTKGETRAIARCLQAQTPPIHSVLLVTSDYHSRRALAIMRHCLPQYRWSVADAHYHPLFGKHWWRRREWMKTVSTEWEKLLWWELVDRWSCPAGGGTGR